MTDGKETCGENGGKERERERDRETERERERERGREGGREGNIDRGEKGAWRTGRSLRSSAGSSAATGRGDLDVGVATRSGGALRKSRVDLRTITVP